MKERFNKGDTAILKRHVIEPATGDHPEFIMGMKDEVVTIIKVHDTAKEYPYLVEGSITNKGKQWRACDSDFKETNAVSTIQEDQDDE